MYIVLRLHDKARIRLNSDPILEDWIKLDFVEGMIGCCPVFKYKKDAHKHAGKDGQVLKIELVAAKQ